MLVAEYAGDAEFSVTERSATAPGPGQVQIAVAYVGICGTDLHVKHGHMDARVTIPGRSVTRCRGWYPPWGRA